MDLWIRVEADIGDAPDVAQLAATLYPDRAESEAHAAAVGHLVQLWGRVARHRVDGMIGDVPDTLLARWAGWPGDPSRFAEAFRALYCDAGVIRDWYDRQGKLVERARADRERKAAERARSGPRPQNVRGQSPDSPLLQDETLRNDSPASIDMATAPQPVELIGEFPALAALPVGAVEAFAAHVLRGASASTLRGLLAEAAAALGGMHGVALDAGELATALRDAVTNDMQPNAALFRGYLARAKHRPAPPRFPSSRRPRSATAIAGALAASKLTSE